MLRNYLLIAWRHLRKGPLFSFINISGLAMGMAIALLIGLWVWDEVNFDHYHPNHERLGEVLSIGKYNGTVEVGSYASVPMGAALRARYPDDFAALSLLAGLGETLRVGDQSLGGWGAWVQADFPRMFGLSMIRGSAGALKEPGAILLNASMAKGLFGSVDVVGRGLVMGDSTALVVGGVYADLPENSSLAMYQFLLSWENMHNEGRENDDDWTNHHYQLFVQLKKGRDFDAVSAKIRDLTKPHIKGGWEEIALHPMDKWHLYDRAENGRMTGGRLQSVRLFGLIGLFVLLLACINFMNLSTAKSEKRAMETGIRKVLGSSRGQLVAQFLGESVLTAFLALLLAVVLVAASLSWFSGMAGRPVPVPWTSPVWWMILLGFAGFVGIIAGSYPAFYLSAFQPGKIISGRRGSLARKVLVVGQFTISMSLIIGTIIVYRQLQFAKDRPVGYTRAGLITVPVGRPGLIDHADVLRQELVQTGAIDDLAISSSPTTAVHNSMIGYDWEGRDPRTVPVIGTLFVGYHFGRTIGWTLAEGRDFLPGSAADSGAFILNEAAVRFTGLTHPVGKVIRWHGVDHPIVGVVRDLVMESPYQPVGPVLFTLATNVRQRYLVMRIAPTLPVKEALARIEKVFHRWDALDAFYYLFVDEEYGQKFSEEERVGKLAAVFGALAVVISCLGLFGLAAFVAEQRTKEIG
ncbi:MAG TPA: ABC transporter permease, partial [Puia sp.]